MSHLNAIYRLDERLAAMELVIRRLSIRINNMVREGTVKSVDPSKGTVVVDAHGIETDNIPWLQQAGAINEWTPPSVGQRVLVVSPDGDLAKAVVMPGGYTNENPQPHDQLGEKRVKIGDAVITHKAGGLVIEVGGTKFEFTSAGFKQTGGKIEHDGKNVGSDHTHTGVMPGASDTGPPNP